MKSALSIGKRDRARRIAHSLASVAVKLGAVRIADAASRIETQLQGLASQVVEWRAIEQALFPILRAAADFDPALANPLFSTAPAQSTVLIIDDEPAMRDLLGEILQDTYHVILASDGQEGFSAAAEKQPDLILLDVHLPGEDGYATLSRLKQQGTTALIPVIFVTGSNDIASETTGLSLGAVDYILKPINPAILAARIDAQIKIKRAEAEARRRIEREHYLELVTEFEHLARLEETRQLELKIKDDFLSHVSHELRAPAQSIHSFVSLVIDGLAGDVTPRQVELLGIALRNVEHLQAMIEDLLEATRLGTGKLQIQSSDVSLAEAVEYAVNTISPAATRKSIQVSASYTNDLPHCLADPKRLRQTLTILLDNAVKFTPPGGSVMVRAGIFHQDSSALIIEVADTGCGIREEKLASVFDRLYQCGEGEEASRGLGLGLHIAQELVQRQGGKIWVESTLGAGSTFHFTVPISPQARVPL
jgi:signal transduction histidine kinase